MKRTCTVEFRKALLNLYPGLADNWGHWRHMSRLCFAQDYSKVPIGIYQVARDYRVLDDLIRHRFIALKFIKEFKQNVLSYQVSSYSPVRHICRHASFKPSPELSNLISKELTNFDKRAKRCFIDNGRLVSKNNLKILKEEDLKLSHLYLSLSNTPPIILKFMTYLNRLPSNRFSKVIDRLPLACEALFDTDSNGNPIVNPNCYMDQLNILQQVREQAQPIYLPSLTGNTVRFFEVNRGLQSVHSYLRDILTEHWIELDLQNAHLAIVAKLWEIPYLQEILSTGKSIWEIIMPTLGMNPLDKESKSNLKTLLYSAVYGMSQNQIVLHAERTLGEKKEVFLSHPIITEILKAKSRVLKTLASKEEHITSLGVKHNPYSFMKNGIYNSNHLSIISEEISEYEALLLEPIFDLAIETKQFVITLYQYDGVSIEPRDNRRRDSILKKIKKAVDERAKELDIHTTITVK